MHCGKTLLLGGLALVIASGARADELVWAMSNGGDGRLWKIDVTANTFDLIGALKDPVLGDVGSGWSTVAETPDKKLYFLRRFVNDINVFSVDSTNMQVSGGVVTNLTSLGSTGLGGNLDGLTAGPDGNIYFTAYDNDHSNFARNGLFRFHPGSGTTDFVGTFANDAGPSGVNSFYTDLAFDPKTGDLIGTGTDSNGAFIPYRLKGSDVLLGNNHTFTYVDAFSSWNGNLFDGLAFNRITGELYASGDSSGVFRLDRDTGAVLSSLAGTPESGIGIGTDLAVQADTIPNPSVPEPGTLSLFAGAMVMGGALLRRRRK